jgi:hypothetical protein
MKYLFLASLILAITITAGCLGDENSRTRRCGLVQYDIYEGFCCGSTFHPARDRYFLECCNGVTYKIDSQFCCNGVIYSSRSSQHCCKGKVEPGGGTWSECGDQCYNIDTHSCCGNTIYNVTNQDCCGKVVYSKTDQACCNKKTVYSTSNQHCCNGKIESGGGTNWFDCSGKCYQADRQSCCFEGNWDSPLLNGTIQEGAGSCCISRPKSMNGMYCAPGNGLYYPPYKDDTWYVVSYYYQ